MSQPVKRTRRLVPGDHTPGVYRLFDAEGQLLYIGCTMNMSGRLRSLSRNKVWFNQVVELHWEPAGRDAYEVEARAIAAENPRHNVLERKPVPMTSAKAFARADAYTDGKLEAYLRESRANGVSFDDMSRWLETRYFPIQASRETVRKWCGLFGITTKQPKVLQ